MDAGIARKLSGIYQHVGLGVSNTPSAMAYILTSAGRGKALPTLLNPVMAYHQCFAAGAAGAARREFDTDTNLLDFLADDVKRMTARLHGSEKEKLDRYLQAFESMTDRQSQLAQMSDRIARATPAIDPKLGVIEETKTSSTGVFDRLEAIGDLGGRLKLGNRYLRYPWYGKPGHRTMASLYTSLLNAVGDRRESFGVKDSKILDLDQSGPLAELMT